MYKMTYLRWICGVTGLNKIRNGCKRDSLRDIGKTNMKLLLWMDINTLFPISVSKLETNTCRSFDCLIFKIE